jgi:hypothetical protein
VHGPYIGERSTGQHQQVLMDGQIHLAGDGEVGALKQQIIR